MPGSASVYGQSSQQESPEERLHSDDMYMFDTPISAGDVALTGLCAVVVSPVIVAGLAATVVLGAANEVVEQCSRAYCALKHVPSQRTWNDDTIFPHYGPK